MPYVKQHLITTPLGKAALEGHEALTSIHVFEKRQSGLGTMLHIRRDIRSLRLKNPVILQPHKSLRSTLLAKLIGFPVVTYAETNASWLAHLRIPRVAVMHEADRPCRMEDLKICEPAMGSGAFLNGVVDELSKRMAQEYAKIDQEKVKAYREACEKKGLCANTTGGSLGNLTWQLMECFSKQFNQDWPNSRFFRSLARLTSLPCKFLMQNFIPPLCLEFVVKKKFLPINS